MDNFDYKKFLTENKMTRNSRLLKEETTMDRLEAHAGFDIEDGAIVSDQGFVFDNKGGKLVAELKYGDYGSSREAGEAVLDPLVDELEKQLENAGAEYKITITGGAYLVDIMIENLDENTLNEEASNGFDVAFSSEGGDALVVTHTSSPDANLLITADKEDINQETVTASGEFVLGGKTLYWLIATA